MRKTLTALLAAYLQLQRCRLRLRLAGVGTGRDRLRPGHGSNHRLGRPYYPYYGYDYGYPAYLVLWLLPGISCVLPLLSSPCYGYYRH